jgi:protein-disulfide isomerase
MSKRQEMLERSDRDKKRNRALIIFAVILGAVLVVSMLVLQNSNTPDTKAIIKITPITSEIPVSKTSMGKPDAPVKMDVWEDFQCPGCRSYSKDLEPQVLQAYVKTGKVYYTFHFYPFIDRGKGESHDAANAAMCATAQGRFWDYHNITFANWLGENAGSFTKPRLVAFAQSIGLDMAAFNTCFQENTYAAQIQKDFDDGTKLGVPPTPGIFVDGQAVESSAGPNYLPSFDDISHTIDKALGGK